jgi:AraC-like DNA-binding protein
MRSLLQLTPLGQGAAVRFSDSLAAKRGLSPLLKSHELKVTRGPLQAEVRSVMCGALTVLKLRYGAEVSVAPGQFSDFFLLQIPVAGEAEICTADTSIQLSPAQAALIPPDLPLLLNWDSHCTQLIVKIPASLLHGLHCDGRESSQLSKAIVPIDLRSHTGRAVVELVSYLAHSAAAYGAAPVPSRLAASAQTLFAEQMVEILSADAGWATDQAPCLGTGKRESRLLNAALALIERRLRENIRLDDLCRELGVSRHTLCDEFKNGMAMSPMAYIKECRFAEARRELLHASPDVTVTDIAYRWGFSNLGRFASLYRERYGEPPRMTRRLAP